jgi:hypothetical protein
MSSQVVIMETTQETLFLSSKNRMIYHIKFRTTLVLFYCGWSIDMRKIIQGLANQ